MCSDKPGLSVKKKMRTRKEQERKEGRLGVGNGKNGKDKKQVRQTDSG